NDDQIISTGYCGSPRLTKNCCDIDRCKRKELGIKPGEHYEWCRGVHAEQNAMIHASRREMLGATLYLVGIDSETNDLLENSEPCKICKRMIINAGIQRIITMVPSGKICKIDVNDLVKNNIGELE
ncbi:MAG: deaminase, partial [Saprospiraceae bacterium]|nr:deaminase [Saprospiraceae bacterium]